MSLQGLIWLQPCHFRDRMYFPSLLELQLCRTVHNIISRRSQLVLINFSSFLFAQIQRERFGLNLLKGTEYFNGYNKRVNSQISNAFSVAGYRFGHSLVRNQFDRLSQSSFEHKCNQCHGKDTKFLPIPVLDFGNPQYLYDKGNGGVDSITRGLLKTPASKADG